MMKITYQVIAKVRGWNTTVEGSTIRVEPYWVAKTYKTFNAAQKFTITQNRINKVYIFDIKEVV